MRPLPWHRGAAVIVGLIPLGVLAACAGTEERVVTVADAGSTVTVTEPETVTVTVAETAAEPVAEPPPADEPANDEEPSQESGAATVGDSITLSGTESTLQVRVTLLKVVDPAQPSDEFFTPDEGNRYVAVRLRLENVGEAVYDDSPSNGAAVIDQGDQEFGADIFDVVEPGLGSPRIGPGDKRVGFITFEVPKRAKLRTFQFALDSGFAPDAGEWTLR